MKRKLGLSLAFAALIILFYFWKKDFFLDKEVTVKCWDMMYACGDCAPNYQVVDISSESLKKKFIDSDIAISFSDTSLEDKFEEQAGKCAICYLYEFQGVLTKPFAKSYYVINVRKYKMTLKSDNCCTDE